MASTNLKERVAALEDEVARLKSVMTNSKVRPWWSASPAPSRTTWKGKLRGSGASTATRGVPNVESLGDRIMLVLDTDHVSVLAWDSHQAQRLRMRLASVASDEVTTTIITFEEQMRARLAYLARARTLAHQVEGYRRLRTQLDNYRLIPVLDFTERAAAELQRLQ